jgi:hypothetical protein
MHSAGKMTFLGWPSPDWDIPDKMSHLLAGSSPMVGDALFSIAAAGLYLGWEDHEFDPRHGGRPNLLFIPDLKLTLHP